MTIIGIYSEHNGPYNVKFTLHMVTVSEINFNIPSLTRSGTAGNEQNTNKLTMMVRVIQLIMTVKARIFLFMTDNNLNRDIRLALVNYSSLKHLPLWI